MMLPAKIRHFLTLPSFFAFFFIILSFLNLGFCVDQQYISCAAQSCGTVEDIHYPFYLSNISPANCGYPGFNLTCANSSLLLYVPPPTNLYLTVLSIDYINRNFTVSLDSSQIATSNDCAYIKQGLNYPLSESLSFPYSTTSSDEKATFYYNCTTPPTFTSSSTGDTSYTGGSSGGGYDISKNLACSILNGSTGGGRLYSYVFYGDSMPSRIQMNCNSTMTVPVLESASVNPGGLFSQYQQSLSAGFGLGWSFKSGGFNCSSCEFSGGRCGYNTSSSTSLCLCQDHPHTGTCGDLDHSGSIMQKHGAVIIGSSVAAAAALLLFCRSFVIARRRYLAKHARTVSESFDEELTNSSLNFFHNESSNSKVEMFLHQYKELMLNRYSFKQIKAMTSNFIEKLGEGGYGTVYKGKLQSQTLVAVKLLDKSCNEGEDFINEVATIGRIHHVNIVRLLGFSVEGTKSALVYEFMPNGSLQSFLTSKQVTSEDGSWWKNLYNIAKMVAEGIEYLHQGCNQRILHFDIKPSNILLDENLIPKISDFGLAKLCRRDKSALSTMTAAKGTIGYMAPEVFYGCSGTVSHKSDVFSFGMLLMEMVGLRNSSGYNTGSSSMTYFPEWIYSSLRNDRELGVEVSSPTGRAIVKKLSIIGLYCIQWNPNDRPSMKTIIQMFDANMDDLQMPANGFFQAHLQQIVDIDYHSSNDVITS